MEGKSAGGVRFATVSSLCISLVQARFAFPSGLAVSEDGATLYVADYLNDRVRKIELRQPTRCRPTHPLLCVVPALGSASAGFGLA